MLSAEAVDLMDNNVRASTKKVYRSRWRTFTSYCKDVGADPSTCPVEVVVNFLAILRRVKGYEYQTICGYRSAIASKHRGLGETPLGKVASIKKLTKACFNEAPPIPRYGDIWDVDKLLSHLEKMHPLDSLSDMELSIKTVSLTFILSLSRASSIAALGPRFQVVEEEIVIPIVAVEKTSRPGKVRGELRCPSGAGHPALSLEAALNEYFYRTSEKRLYHMNAEGQNPDRLFIANTKPFQAVKPVTLARWLLTAMEGSGIDTTSFKAHSSRSAASSDLVRRGLSLAQISKRAHWSESSRTFQIFYNRA